MNIYNREIMLSVNDFYPLKIQPEQVDEKSPLLEMLVMVKNGGLDFQMVLLENIQHVDQWSILDTGSTDGTWEWLVELQKHHPNGYIFQEPFITFRDSRNRLLDLTQNHLCTFQIMLDDTYLLQNTKVLLEFLTLARTAPKESYNSFSLYIEEESDIKYLSNRIFKTENKIRYDSRYSVHEIPARNLAFSIPREYGYIQDKSSSAMKARTKQRKQYDLDMLLIDHEKYPNNLRIYYYIAETYLSLEDYKNAAVWYEKRGNAPHAEPVEHGYNEDYNEERYDAKYKLAVMHDFHLNSPWNTITLGLYLEAHAYLPTRPECMFMIGYHYFNQKESSDLAYTFLRRAFEIGIPQGGMNLKLFQINSILPEILSQLCFQFHDYVLGEKVSRGNSGHKMQTIHRIFELMIQLGGNLMQQRDTTSSLFTQLENGKKWIVFVTSSAWEPYNGMTLRTKGLGGSETCIIRFAEEIAINYPNYQVAIFCPCDKPGTAVNLVNYFDVSSYISFLSSQSTKIHRVFLQRSTEYVLPTTESSVHCYLHLHDTLPDEEVLIGHSSAYFHGVICLSEWHKKLFQQIFGFLNLPVFVQSYGCNLDPLHGEYPRKIPHSFIYPSFPNRGLSILVDMWPKILAMWPDATLNLFCDFRNRWLNQTDMKQIEDKISLYPSIVNHGWQSHKVLKKQWGKSHFWLYPCIFAETFCLTAIEARIYHTNIITCDLGALKETIGSDGILIEGNPLSVEWQNAAMDELKKLDNVYHKSNIKELSERGYSIQVNKFMTRFT